MAAAGRPALQRLAVQGKVTVSATQHSNSLGSSRLCSRLLILGACMILMHSLSTPQLVLHGAVSMHDGAMATELQWATLDQCKRSPPAPHSAPPPSVCRLAPQEVGWLRILQVERAALQAVCPSAGAPAEPTSERRDVLGGRGCGAGGAQRCRRRRAATSSDRPSGRRSRTAASAQAGVRGAGAAGRPCVQTGACFCAHMCMRLTHCGAFA